MEITNPSFYKSGGLSREPGESVKERIGEKRYLKEASAGDARAQDQKMSRCCHCAAKAICSVPFTRLPLHLPSFPRLFHTDNLMYS